MVECFVVRTIAFIQPWPIAPIAPIAPKHNNNNRHPYHHHPSLPLLLDRNRLWAKPPPTSIFDLDAIEAFESELAGAAAIQGQDGDDDDYAELDVEATKEINVVKRFEISSKLSGKRIDAVLAILLEPDLSRSFCGTLLTDGYVSVMEPTQPAADEGNYASTTGADLGEVNVSLTTTSGKAPPSDLDNNRRVVVTKKSFKVATGQWLEVQIPSVSGSATEIVPQDIPLNILYEDEHMIVLNKAAGMVVHPAAGNWDGTVVNALVFYLTHHSPYGRGDYHANDDRNNGGGSGNSGQQVGGMIDSTGWQKEQQQEALYFRPGIVHRLDKGTTGVLVVAKTHVAHAALSAAFAQRQVQKIYMAITVGNPGKQVVIDKPIERHPIHRQRMRVVPDPHRRSGGGVGTGDDRLLPTSGRRALSLVDTLAFDGKLALVQVQIETGRTHQIRVHLQDRHTPIYGDDVYGLADWNRRLQSQYQINDRPLLHAYRLQLNHPVTGQIMVFTAPLAPDMQTIAQIINPQGKQEFPELFAAQ
ncbi:hypothetical protein ACA910_012788 [Epithemia clementina (nom. ined.)]